MRPTSLEASAPQEKQGATGSSREASGSSREPPQSKASKLCGAFQHLNSDLASMVTSWLSSFATTHLRAASRACQEIFSRNCPYATTTDYVISDYTSRFQNYLW